MQNLLHLTEIFNDAKRGTLSANPTTDVAASLRMDGSVEKCQIDSKFIMLKTVKADGDLHLIFLGFEESMVCGLNFQ